VAHGLAQTGRRVLVIDGDHQCNSTLALCAGVSEKKAGTFWDVMMERRPVSEVIQRTPFTNLDIVQGSMWLSNANTQLASQFGREMILQKGLEGVNEVEGADGMKGYHYILIDTPPNTELITVNCWVASNALVVPLTPSWFAMFGIRILEIQLAEIKKQTGRDFPIFGVVIAMDDHTNKSTRRAGEIREYFGEKVFSSVIPKNVRVEMATDESKPIYDYAPGSTGANAYAGLVAEFIQRSEVEVSANV